MAMKGICCTCQQEVDIGTAGPNHLMSDGDREELEYDTDPYHQFRWVCLSHDAWGPH